MVDTPVLITVLCAVAVPAIVAILVLGRVLMVCIRSNNLNFATAARHMERRYRAADDHMMRIAEKETADPIAVAQIHANERDRQSSRDSGIDRDAIDAAAESHRKDEHETLGGVGYVDE